MSEVENVMDWMHPFRRRASAWPTWTHRPVWLDWMVDGPWHGHRRARISLPFPELLALLLGPLCQQLSLVEPAPRGPQRATAADLKRAWRTGQVTVCGPVAPTRRAPTGR